MHRGRFCSLLSTGDQLRIIVILVAIFVRPLCVSATEPNDWPGFRGARGDGVSAVSAPWISGPTQLGITWKKTLGGGYSGVSVADDYVIAMYSDARSDIVIALAAEDGRELWRYELDETYKGHDGSQDGPISTPFVSEGRVFALSPRGKLAALDLVTGKSIWEKRLIADHGAIKPHWGFGTSPRVVSGVLVVEVGAKDAMVCGFDAQTGRLLWSVGDDSIYYQSPVSLRSGGGTQFLAAGDKKILRIDARSGRVLWEFLHNGSGEYGALCMVPVPIGKRGVFLDHKDDESMLLTTRSEDAATHLESRWEERGFARSYSVAVHHNGFIYGYKGRTATCVDAATGKTLWRSRQPGDGFPILIGDQLVILTKDGSLHVAKASPERYDEVESLKIFADVTWTPPSFARGSLFARSFGEIARIDAFPGAPLAGIPSDEDHDIGGTRFADFVEELQATEDKTAAIDRFLDEAAPFPMIEPDGRVVFVYRGPGEDLVIGGDLTGFGRKLPMSRVAGSDLFYAVARLEPDARISYAFIRDFSAFRDPLNPRKTMAAGYDEDMELNYDNDEIEMSWVGMPEWKQPTHLRQPDASRRGRTTSHVVKSEVLGADVSIDVYTPSGYEESMDRLPVAYLHDGKTARDSLRITTALDNLIGRRVAPVISVFIHQQPPFFAAEKYARMCAVELPEFIDANYRTIPSRDARAHVAWGQGGYGAIFTVLAHADQTGKLGVQSPFMVDLSPIEPVMKTASEWPLDVYLDWGKYDTRSELEFWSIAETGRELQTYLKDHGYDPLGGEANDGSGVGSWQNRVDDLFAELFPVVGKR